MSIFFAFSTAVEKNIITPLADNLGTEAFQVKPSAQQKSSIFHPAQFFRSQKNLTISAADIAQIKTLPQVSSVETETRLPFPVAIRAKVILGIDFYLDAMVSGYSQAAVQEFLPADITFSATEQDFVPVLISPLLVSIYNSTVAEIVPGAGQKKKEDFLGKEIDFSFGKVHYLHFLYNFPEETTPTDRTAKIVGTAPFLSPFTLAIPQELAQQMKEQYSESKNLDTEAHSLLVKTRTPEDALSIKQQLQKQGFMVQDLSERSDILRRFFFYFQLVFVLTLSLLLLLSFLFLMLMLLSAVTEKQQEIGILRALGATKTSIMGLFLLQGLVIVLLGAGIGFVSSVFLAPVIEAYVFEAWAQADVYFDVLFVFDISRFAIAGLILLVSTFLLALLPARKAAKLKPLAAILQ